MPTVTSYLTAISQLAGGVGTWTSATVAQLNADDAALAVWNKPSGTNNVSPGLRCSGFDVSAIPSGSTINSVLVEANSFVANTSRMAAWTYELWDADTAIIGSAQTGTNTTSTTNVDSFTDTTVTFSQLSTLVVRMYAHGGGTSTASTGSSDYIRITVDYTPPLTGSATLPVTAAIAADGVVPVPGGGSSTREGRYGRSQPAAVVFVRSEAPAATPGQGDAVLSVASSITADGFVLALATPQPIVVGQAEQQALFLRTRGTPYPALVSRASSADPGLDDSASLAVTNAIIAGGTAGGTASLPVTASLTAAGGTSSGASLPVTATITAAGTAVSGFSGSATLAVTATITAAGAVATSSSATLAVTASRSAAGVVGTSAGASLAAAAAITAAGVVGTSTGASLVATATITAAGTVVSGSSGTASLPVTAAFTSAGQVARFATASLPVLATLAAIGNMAAATGATRPVTVTFTATGQVISAGDGTPVKNPGTLLTIPVPGITLTMPATATALTVPAARTELT